jgi:hypothetical protein
MNQEIKTKWLEALRSGAYQQGRTYLRTDNKYCCLGVLCDLHAKATNTEWIHNYVISADAYLNATCLLPGKVGCWAGLDSEDTDPLIHMNDNGEPFSQIATFIEKEQRYEPRSES